MKRETGGNSSLPGIISKNPQIRSFCVDGADSEFLRNVNTQLPQLVALELSGFRPVNGNIRFENVNKFVIGSGSGYKTSTDTLYFPRLQTFHIDNSSLLQAKHQTFLNKHRHLSHLSLTTNDLNGFQFQEITAILTNLLEITLERAEIIGVYAFRTDVTVEFLRTHHKVKKLNIINYPKDRQIELQKQLNREWNSRFIDGSLSFERKSDN